MTPLSVPTKTPEGIGRERITDKFNVSKKYGEFAKVQMDHNDNAMSYRWKTMESHCNKFHGVIEQIRGRNEWKDNGGQLML